MGGGPLSLVLGGLGVLLLFRMVRRLRPGARVRDSVVVITGASSGLGRGQRPRGEPTHDDQGGGFYTSVGMYQHSTHSVGCCGVVCAVVMLLRIVMLCVL